MNVRISSANSIRVAAAHRHRLRFLLAEQLAEESLAALLIQVGGGGGQLRDRVRLHVLRPAQRPQVGDQLVFVARRQQRRQQDDVRYPGVERRDGGVA